MSYKVKLLPNAYSDLRKAKKWYNEQREGLGEEFKAEVNKEIDYISYYPRHYQTKFKDLRQSLVSRFPYAIFYSIDEEGKRIIIFGILFTGRNPRIIKERIKK